LLKVTQSTQLMKLQGSSGKVHVAQHQHQKQQQQQRQQQRQPDDLDSLLNELREDSLLSQHMHSSKVGAQSARVVWAAVLEACKLACSNSTQMWLATYRPTPYHTAVPA
jgi:hypothetical protein